MPTVKPEEIVAILKEHGTYVSVEQAEMILRFMYKLANMELDQYLEDGRSSDQELHLISLSEDHSK